MKNVGLCAVGNAIIDLLIEVEEEEFDDLGLKKGGMQLVSSDEQSTLIKKIHASRDDLVFKSGGSAANSVIAYAQLGGRAGFIGTVGADELGKEYEREMREIGIDVALDKLGEGSTGTCLILVTPDAERTMNTSLGCAGMFNKAALDLDLVKRSKWLLLEGYLFSNPSGTESSLRELIDTATSANTKLALTCSDSWVIESCFPLISELLPSLSLIVANEVEAITFAKLWSKEKNLPISKESNVEWAFEILKALVPECIVTLGDRGVLLGSKESSKVHHVEAFETEAIDLTGAGDAFLGSYLNAIDGGHSRQAAARIACFVASKVVAQLGPRLQDPKWLIEELRMVV